LGFQYDPFTAFAILGTVITLVVVAIYILINVCCIAYYARFRRDEFNILLHLIVPLLGIAVFVPALLPAAGIKVFSFFSPLPTPRGHPRVGGRPGHPRSPHDRRRLGATRGRRSAPAGAGRRRRLPASLLAEGVRGRRARHDLLAPGPRGDVPGRRGPGHGRQL